MGIRVYIYIYIYIDMGCEEIWCSFFQEFSPHTRVLNLFVNLQIPRIKYLYVEISCMHYVFCTQTMFSLFLFRGIAFVVATNSCRMWTGVCREEITYGAELLIATAFTNKRVLAEATFPTDICFR